MFLVCVLGVAGLATGCGSSGSGSSAANNNYLSELHSAAPDIGNYRSDTELVRLGHAACDGFGAGASYETVADRLALQDGNPALPSEDLGDVITSAADNYCPAYRDRVS